jgi:hypothetical protein
MSLLETTLVGEVHNYQKSSTKNSTDYKNNQRYKQNYSKTELNWRRYDMVYEVAKNKQHSWDQL